MTDLEAREKLDAAQRTLREWFRGTHYVNVLIRRNGKDEVHEADWLRHLPDAWEAEARRVRAEALREAVAFVRSRTKIWSGEVGRLRALSAQGHSTRKIAHAFGLSQFATWAAIRGVTWAHVDGARPGVQAGRKESA